ncbi:hypothetical protein HanXRQr2_Chr07g0296971 [Helianthus annuus]|uniref:Uncharacterized protein n=1 Tax=Helianthus annuus TaxID=4232 RepID=A0A9K3IKZ4_HELAN|nr:hypothetical protein HanXRQr2_Chr07g0296971 [Helianthus annuus]KAJ0904883.1 hypothetical protein HanPSC8_Chr07g0287481 [Helianthus annuus]
MVGRNHIGLENQTDNLTQGLVQIIHCLYPPHMTKVRIELESPLEFINVLEGFELVLVFKESCIRARSLLAT